MQNWRGLAAFIGIAVLTGCQPASPLLPDLPGVPALVESPLGTRLNLGGPVAQWPSGKTAQVGLLGENAGTVDPSGQLSVKSELVPAENRLAAPAYALLRTDLAGAFDLNERCPVNDLSVSDPAARVVSAPQLDLRRKVIGVQTSPPVRLAALQRLDGEHLYHLVYADRDVSIKGQRLCHGQRYPWKDPDATWAVAAAIHLHLQRGWNSVMVQQTIRGNTVQLVVAGDSEMNTPWTYNGGVLY